MNGKRFTIGNLEVFMHGKKPKDKVGFEVNNPHPGVVFKALQGTFKDGVFQVGKGLEDHLLCWYCIEGSHKTPIKAIKKSVYHTTFMTGLITNYVIVVDSRRVL